MSVVICIWIPAANATPEHAASLLELAPRVVLDGRGVVWADARGVDGEVVAARLLVRLRELGLADVERARAGVAAVPIVAELAACAAGSAAAAQIVRVVPAGRERAFVESMPLGLLAPDERLLALVQGVGIETCGAFAVLEREAVEVRFGAEAVRIWQLARCVDERRLFPPAQTERPHSSLDFIDYVVTDPERLVFTANALLGSICDALGSRGEHAKRLVLSLTLANKQMWTRTLRPARATASRVTWLRLIRAVLEKLTVPDAVTGLSLEVQATEPASAIQGDLFDAGFATASAVDAAVARLLEAQGEVFVRPAVNEHPLAELRSSFSADDALVSEPKLSRADAAAELTLQVLPEPKPVLVETVNRRDHVIPIRYRDARGWVQLVTAAGPDRVSGGRWGDAYAREYFRGVTFEGKLVWLFREAREDNWYIHGWWD
jgi:hypothetical protein